MASFKKRLKKAARVTHKYAGRILSVAAPIAGAIIAGPAGAALGAAVGTSASYYGEKQGALASGKKGKSVKKAGRRGLKRGAIVGGAVTLGAGAIALGAGTGVATSSLGAVSSIFGGGTSKGPVTKYDPELGYDEARTGRATTQADLERELSGGSSATGDIASRALGAAARAATKYREGKPGRKDGKDEGILDQLKDLLSGKDAEGNDIKILGLPKPVVVIGAAVLIVYLLKGAGAQAARRAA